MSVSKVVEITDTIYQGLSKIHVRLCKEYVERRYDLDKKNYQIVFDIIRIQSSSKKRSSSIKHSTEVIPPPRTTWLSSSNTTKLDFKSEVGPSSCTIGWYRTRFFSSSIATNRTRLLVVDS